MDNQNDAILGVLRQEVAHKRHEKVPFLSPNHTCRRQAKPTNYGMIFTWFDFRNLTQRLRDPGMNSWHHRAFSRGGLSGEHPEILFHVVGNNTPSFGVAILLAVWIRMLYSYPFCKAYEKSVR